MVLALGRSISSRGKVSKSSGQVEKAGRLVAKTKHHHHHGESGSESVGFHRPYWRSAHKDWRLWIAVGLMLIAMFTYIASGDLVWRPGSHTPQRASNAVAK